MCSARAPDGADKETAMEEKSFYLETASHDPAYNLAFEEYVLTHRMEGSYLILWQNDNTVVVGQNQNTQEEIDCRYVEEHGVHVVRRMTGGGAVYHDLGNINYSFITDRQGDDLVFTRFTEPIVQALRALGLDAKASGRNDILVAGQKVSGTAQRYYQGRVLHHGTLLFDSDLDKVALALRADPLKFRSKASKSVRRRVGNIRALLPQDMELPAFWDYLKRSLLGGSYEELSLGADELAQVDALKVEKYDTWEWNYGRSPRCEMNNKQAWPGGILSVSMDVVDGKITEIAFHGDFLSTRPMAELVTALRGTPYRAEEVGAVLDRMPLAELFGAITRDEVLATMFYF